MKVVTQTNLPLQLFHRGKVRDTHKIYWLGDLFLLMVATDRVSAFDVVLPNAIPHKGKVLNQLSAFWFKKTAHLLPNHLVKVVDCLKTLKEYSGLGVYPKYSVGHSHKNLVGRSMIVRQAERLPVECVVRGYLAGSAWAEYRREGTIQGQPMPPGLAESQELPHPLFTPTTKAEMGHDLPLRQDGLRKLVGEKLAAEVEARSLEVYSYARDYAAGRGIIIADTKFEFGLIDGKLALIDELLTPDSSRFWDAKLYKVGQSQPSYDKQPLRDWLEATGWNKEPPPPTLPPEVVQATSRRYLEAYWRLTGGKLS